jgi:putative inorganic carbon (HCO3(-)) transporter
MPTKRSLRQRTRRRPSFPLEKWLVRVAPERWEKWLLGLGIFALPLMVYPEGHPSPTVTKATVALIWVGGLLGLAAVRLLRSEDGIRVNGLWLPFGALFVAGVLSLVNSLNWQASLMTLALVLGYFVLALLVAHHVRRPEDARWVLGLLVAAGSLAALYGLLQYYGLLSGHSRPRLRAELITSTFGNKNYIGGYLAYVLLPGLGLLVLATRRWVKAGALAALAVSFTALLAIDSDGVWLSLLGAGLLLIIGLLWGRLWGGLQRGRPWVLGLVGLWVVIAVAHSLPAVLTTAVGERDLISSIAEPFTKESAKIRLFDWLIAWEMLRDHPLLGVGLEHYKVQFLPYKAKALATGLGERLVASAYVPTAHQAHNDYVQWAAETGSLGILALLFAVGYWLWRALRGLWEDPEPEGKLLRLVVLAGIGTFAAHALVDFPIHLPASALTLVVFLGILASASLQAKSHDRGEWSFPCKRAHVRALAVIVMIAAVLFTALGVREFQANAHLKRAMVLVAEGDLAQAQSELERSMALSFVPDHNALVLGTIYSLQGRDEESLGLFRLALRARSSEIAYVELGRALLLTEQREAGRQVLTDLLAMTPRADVAVEAYRLWELAGLPHVSELLRAERAIQTGDYRSATQTLLRLGSEELDPRTQRELLRLQAELALQRGAISEARALLQSVLETDAEDEEIHVRLAQVLAGEQPEEALALLSRARSILKQKIRQVKAGLAALSPSRERQILRTRLEVLEEFEQNAKQLQQRLSEDR